MIGRAGFFESAQLSAIDGAQFLEGLRRLLLVIGDGEFFREPFFVILNREHVIELPRLLGRGGSAVERGGELGVQLRECGVERTADALSEYLLILLPQHRQLGWWGGKQKAE